MELFPSTLFIKIIDGQPVDHPVLDINLEHIYGSLDNIPSEYQVFMRVPQNVVPGHYQKAVATYQQVDGIWQDVWIVEDLNEEETLARQQEIHTWLLETETTLRRKTEKLLAESKNPDEIAALTQYVSMLDSWELDITNPNFPDPPVFNLTTNSWEIPS
jgi:hypothetical protein